MYVPDPPLTNWAKALLTVFAWAETIDRNMILILFVLRLVTWVAHASTDWYKVETGTGTFSFFTVHLRPKYPLSQVVQTPTPL